MNDHDDIRQLIAVYAHLIDDRRFDEWVELFTADAVFTFWGQTHDGRPDIKDAMSGILAGSTGIGKHLVFSPVIRLDGADTALAWTDFAAIAENGDGLRVVAAGRYYDRLARDQGRWRFARRDVRAAGESLPAGAVEGPPA